MEEILRNSLTSTSSTSMPMPSLVSRLDRLDSLMKHLEGKREKDASRRRWASCSEIGPLPLEWAVMEAQLKGSVSDRIASLEYRLVQLFLQMESEDVEATSSESSQMEQTSPELTNSKSPTLSTKDRFSLSFSRFRTSARAKKHSQQNCIDKFEMRETKEKEHQKPKHNEEESLERTSRNHVEETSSPKPKKMVPSRLHLRLLGC